MATQSFFTVHVADIDGDGDNDIVASSAEEVAWIENLDGTGNFGEPNVIAPLPSPVATVSDLDGDHDLDVLTQNIRGELIWYENDGGTFVLAHNIGRSEQGSPRVAPVPFTLQTYIVMATLISRTA